MNSNLLHLKPVYLIRAVSFADYPTLDAAAEAAFCDVAAIYRALARVEAAVGFWIYRRGCGGRGGRPRPPQLNDKGKVVIRQLREILTSFSALGEIGGIPDSDFATAAARAKIAKRLAVLSQPAAGGRH